MKRVILNRTGRIYILYLDWFPTGSQEENKINRELHKSYFIDHFNDFYALGQIEKNGKPFGRVFPLFKSEVTEL